MQKNESKREALTADFMLIAEIMVAAMCCDVLFTRWKLDAICWLIREHCGLLYSQANAAAASSQCNPYDKRVSTCCATRAISHSWRSQSAHVQYCMRAPAAACADARDARTSPSSFVVVVTYALEHSRALLGIHMRACVCKELLAVAFCGCFAPEVLLEFFFAAYT